MILLEKLKKLAESKIIFFGSCKARRPNTEIQVSGQMLCFLYPPAAGPGGRDVRSDRDSAAATWQLELKLRGAARAGTGVAAAG